MIAPVVGTLSFFFFRSLIIMREICAQRGGEMLTAFPAATISGISRAPKRYPPYSANDQMATFNGSSKFCIDKR